jgi:hypothetical protein
MLGERKRALNQDTRECLCQPPLSDHPRHRFVYIISYPIVVSNNTPRRGVIGGSSIGNYFIEGNWALRYTPVDLL